MKFHAIALSLLALAGAAQADVQVKFVSPEKFSDIKDNNGFRQSETALKSWRAIWSARPKSACPGATFGMKLQTWIWQGRSSPWVAAANGCG